MTTRTAPLIHIFINFRCWCSCLATKLIMLAVIFGSLSTTTLRAQYWNCSALCCPCDLLNGNVINKRKIIAFRTDATHNQHPKANEKSLAIYAACRCGFLSVFLLCIFCIRNVSIVFSCLTLPLLRTKVICLVFLLWVCLFLDSNLSVFAWTHLICLIWIFHPYFIVRWKHTNEPISNGFSFDFSDLSLIMWICQWQTGKKSVTTTKVDKKSHPPEKRMSEIVPLMPVNHTASKWSETLYGRHRSHPQKPTENAKILFA